jgi:hypothetical protein
MAFENLRGRFGSKSRIEAENQELRDKLQQRVDEQNARYRLAVERQARVIREIATNPEIQEHLDLFSPILEDWAYAAEVLTESVWLSLLIPKYGISLLDIWNLKDLRVAAGHDENATLNIVSDALKADRNNPIS